MGNEFPSFLKTTKSPPINPKVSEGLLSNQILFCWLKSHQQCWTIRLEGRVVNSCSLKAWKLTKAILVKGEGGRWMRRMGVGRDSPEVERVIGGVCFPDSFQRKESSVVCCGTENTVQHQWCSFFSSNNYFPWLIPFRLTKYLLFLFHGHW